MQQSVAAFAMDSLQTLNVPQIAHRFSPITLLAFATNS
jgi:hypothetical protein